MNLSLSGLELGGDPLHGLVHIVAAVEGRNAEIPLPSGTKAGTGGADHMAALQQLIEKVPTGEAIGRFSPTHREHSPHRTPGCPRR